MLIRLLSARLAMAPFWETGASAATFRPGLLNVTAADSTISQADPISASPALAPLSLGDRRCVPSKSLWQPSGPLPGGKTAVGGGPLLWPSLTLREGQFICPLGLCCLRGAAEQRTQCRRVLRPGGLGPPSVPSPTTGGGSILHNQHNGGGGTLLVPLWGPE